MGLVSSLDSLVQSQAQLEDGKENPAYDKDLHFCCKFLSEISTKNKEGKQVEKKLETLVYFRTFKPKTSMESTFKDVKGLEVRKLLSQNGILAIVLVLMVFGIFYYDTLCKNYTPQ